MNTLNLRIKYRPLRIGWCLVSNDISALRNAFQFSHTMWGGRFNPVIPVDKSDLAIKLVKLFRVDVLFPVSEDKKVAKFIEQFAYLPTPFFHSELFIKVGSEEFLAQILDLYHPIRHLYERHIKNNPSQHLRQPFMNGKKKILFPMFSWQRLVVSLQKSKREPITLVVLRNTLQLKKST